MLKGSLLKKISLELFPKTGKNCDLCEVNLGGESKNERSIIFFGLEILFIVGIEKSKTAAFEEA
jgi:hypothetical protein